MNLSKASNLRDNIIDYLNDNYKNFQSFESIYLFGSVLDKQRYPTDIDILIVYSFYSNLLLDDVDKFRFNLQNKFKMSIDLTILSVDELKDTNFLKRIKKYYQIK